MVRAELVNHVGEERGRLEQPDDLLIGRADQDIDYFFGALHFQVFDGVDVVPMNLGSGYFQPKGSRLVVRFQQLFLAVYTGSLVQGAGD